MTRADLRSALVSLYAGPPENFVSGRAALVKQAKTSGDAELARELGEMRKPTRGAWLVNQLARSEPGDLGEVLDLGEALSAAHREASGDKLRELTRLRTRLIAALVTKAAALGSEQGYRAPQSALQEVAETLTAALADSQLADLIKAGLLAQCVRASAFGPVDMLNPIPGVVRLPTNNGADQANAGSIESPDLGEPKEAAEQPPKIPDLALVRAAERALVLAEGQVENAGTRYRQVCAERDRASAEREAENRTVEDLRRQLLNAEERLAETDTRVARAEEDLLSAQRDVSEAEKGLAQAQEQIRALGLET